ncbi:MAG TPA: hypothetical protein VFG47_13400 [Geminicoccaceae bacterium]|nr:hypothetical protein [Geminicoccaceae bacterium]
MRIEFMGMTGAGKSTLAQGVCARLRAAGHRVALAPDGLIYRHRRLLRVYKILNVAGYCARHPLRALAAARAVRGFRQPNGAGWWRLLFNWLYVNAAMSRRGRPRRLLVLEQGVAQGLYSLALQADRTDGVLFRRALAAGERPELVVFVEAPCEVVSARMRGRAATYTATERLLLADGELMAKSVRSLGAIARALEEQRVPVQRCDTHLLSAAAAADAVAAAILQRLAPT